MNLTNENNIISVSGVVLRNLRLISSINGENFYETVICSKRTSNNSDDIPIIISDRMEINLSEIKPGTKTFINGEIRTHNCKMENGTSKLTVHVFANELQITEDMKPINNVTLSGYLCKKASYRTTPKTHREIADLMIAVNRVYGKSDYIPCICWGRNARYIKDYQIGKQISVKGRLQSRIYEKDKEKKVAYEVSIFSIQ